MTFLLTFLVTFASFWIGFYMSSLESRKKLHQLMDAYSLLYDLYDANEAILRGEARENWEA